MARVEARKTQQVVLSGTVGAEGAAVRWALRREPKESVRDELCRRVGQWGMADALLPAAVAVATGFFCWLATGALIPILRRRDMLDYPNERSSHFAPTPRGGGIAVTGSILLAWIALHKAGLVASSVISIALGAGLLALVSWIDDLRGLSPGMRLVAQGVGGDDRYPGAARHA